LFIPLLQIGRRRRRCRCCGGNIRCGAELTEVVECLAGGHSAAADADADSDNVATERCRSLLPSAAATHTDADEDADSEQQWTWSPAGPSQPTTVDDTVVKTWILELKKKH